MKKTTITLAILAMLLLTSCLPETPPPPYGIWKSEEPRIVLYFKPQYRVFEDSEFIYFGVYTIDGVDRKIFTNFGNGLWLDIFDLTALRKRREGMGYSINHSGRLLAAPYRLVGDEIHYLISTYTQEMLNINDIIVFRRIEDYEPIDPEWIANFEPMPE